MTKTVSFDLDGTLVKSNYADLVWLKGLPKIYSEEKNVSFDEAKKNLFEKYDEVSHHRIEWYDIDYWFKRFDLKSSWKELLEEYSYAIKSFNDVKNTLDKLSKKFDLIIASNAKKEFISIQIKELGFEKYFKKMYSSISDFDCVKKHPDFYRKISKDLNVKPWEIVHIGDSYEFDFLSSKKAGLNAYFLDRSGLNEGKNIVNSLDNFVKKLI